MAAPGVKREAEEDWGSLLGPPASLSLIQSISQWQVYSAGRDIPAKLIPEPSTGTKLDITANDQIRPIATTTAIPTTHARICIPLRRVELADRARIFFRRPNMRQFTNAQNFLQQGPRKIGGDD